VNILNRVVAILLFLLVLALAVGTLGVVTGMLTASMVDAVRPYPPLHHALSDLAHLRPMNVQIITVAGAALTAVLMLFLLARELTPPRPERTVLLAQNQEGEVTIGYDTLRKVAEMAAVEVQRVAKARCTVTTRKGVLRVRCRATADPYSNAGAVGLAVEAAVRSQLEQTLGKPVEHVAVRVELEKPGTPVHVS
jgi:hypothetical protein